MQDDYAIWFEGVTGHRPHGWQARLGRGAHPCSRVLRIPTGLGKTAGVFGAWTWNRLVRRDPEWPRRLIWALPMRVLVEQTISVLRRMLDDAGHGEVPVIPMLGGEVGDQWHLQPEQEAVFVGTQDMLLSRALNRGYAAPRARWPMEFALLHRDSLWVLDEVQLMDVGLITTSQLQSFRGLQTSTFSWWMSATLRADWLQTVDTSPEVRSACGDLVTVPATERTGPVFDASKPVSVEECPPKPAEAAVHAAELILARHRPATASLVIVNTVRMARQVHAELSRRVGEAGVEIRLIHSRFRPCDRAAWREDFLRPDAGVPAGGRIMVSTQVVEAGVDISADLLVTELAPWANLVQRFGRAARFGGSASIVVLDRGLEGKDLLPYDAEQVSAARAALATVEQADLAELDQVEERLRVEDPALAERLFHYDPRHVLNQDDLFALFDTTPDLTGADLDIGRFIRSHEDRDVGIVWFEGEEAPPASYHPTREAICQVGIVEARDWLFSGKTKPMAYAWDFIQGRWVRASRSDCRPGAVLAVSAHAGGYDPKLGFTGEMARGKEHISTVPAPQPTLAGLADYGHSFDDVSVQEWKTVATHGRETAEQVRELVDRHGLGRELAGLLDLAARLHDWGKCHPVFQSAIRRDMPERPEREDLAKAPAGAWHGARGVYGHDAASGPRPGFRHELASVLACFELLRRHRPDHPAFEGAQVAAAFDDAAEAASDSALAAELAALSADEFDLVVYLVSAHHGKVRGRLHASPHDQECFRAQREMPIRGICTGDRLPAVALTDQRSMPRETAALELSLEPAALGLSTRYGRSWTERVLDLVDRHGPFELAWWETLIRVADVRASRLPTVDVLLERR